MTAVLCWDIDGTLLTTQRAGILAFEQALREVCGVHADLMDVRTSGLTDSEVAAYFLDYCGCEPTPALAEAVLRRYEHHLPDRLGRREGTVLPGVREALEAFSARDDVLLLLLTGNTPVGARAKLEHYGLGQFFAGGAFCENSDPRETIAHRVLALAAERLGREPDRERLYVVGDTPVDVRCGNAIGARTVAVATGIYSLDELRACGPWVALEAIPEPAKFATLLGFTTFESRATAGPS